MFFDSHAHYDDKRFDKDREALFGRMAANGVDYILNCGADMRSSLRGIRFAEDYDMIWAAVGVHPHDAQNMKDEDLGTLAEWAAHPKVVAIGEIGLDFHYDFSPRDEQRKWFSEQLALAETVDLPIIVHSREAAQACFDMVKASRVRRGVIHSFSGSVEMALAYVKLGFYIGVGGIITFDKTRKLAEVVKALPMARILIETDAPYLSPVPHRGERNDSQKLAFIAAEIGRIKQMDMEKVAEITKENALSIFVG